MRLSASIKGIIIGILLTVPAGGSATEVLTPERFLEISKKHTGDYDQMVERRVIRFLIPYSRTFFFFDGAVARGLSYDAAQEFEKFINKKEKKGHLKVNVVVIPTPRDKLIEYLIEGRGDVAIGNLTITQERLKQVAFSDPFYQGVNEIVVTAKGHPTVNSVNELAGLTVHVRGSSSYGEHLQHLNLVLQKKGLAPVNIELIEENLEAEDILDMVNAGMIERTIVDDHKAKFWKKIFQNIKLHPNGAIHRNGQIGWMIRQDSNQLKSVINSFVKGHKKGTLTGNILINRYLKNTNYVKNALASEDYRRFQNLEGLFQKFGEKYGLDYLLLAALAYQESRLDQSVRSQVGAVGVMQVLPSTAEDNRVAVPNIEEVENNIHAGTKYLRLLADSYFPQTSGLTELNRGLFALASYNAGPGKVRRLRTEAEKMGLDPNVWFQNVEVVAARRIGRETVQYVSNIVKYYVAYKMLENKMKTN